MTPSTPASDPQPGSTSGQSRSSASRGAIEIRKRHFAAERAEIAPRHPVSRPREIISELTWSASRTPGASTGMQLRQRRGLIVSAIADRRNPCTEPPNECEAFGETMPAARRRRAAVIERSPKSPLELNRPAPKWASLTSATTCNLF